MPFPWRSNNFHLKVPSQHFQVCNNMLSNIRIGWFFPPGVIEQAQFALNLYSIIQSQLMTKIKVRSGNVLKVQEDKKDEFSIEQYISELRSNIKTESNIYVPVEG